MSRTLSGGITSHLAGRSHTRCDMLLLDLEDGTSIGITDHSADLDFDIGDGLVTYDAGTGVLASDVAMSCGLDADNYEVRGPVGDVVTLAAILGGRFNRARARLFQVNWNSLTDGAIPILSGNVSEARIEGGEFVMAIRSDVDRFNQTVGRTITNQCPWDFADGINCHATATSITGTVTSVVNAMHFTVSFAGSYIDALFNKGTAQFLTGTMAGTKPIEIETWYATGEIILFTPAVDVPAVGDTMTIKNGCSKARSGPNGCISHNAILDFGGYPEIPGSDQALRAAIPGQGDQ